MFDSNTILKTKIVLKSLVSVFLKIHNLNYYYPKATVTIFDADEMKLNANMIKLNAYFDKTDMHMIVDYILRQLKIIAPFIKIFFLKQ